MATLTLNAHSRLAATFHRIGKLSIRRLFLRFVAVNAEARIHKVRLEAELYRKHRPLRSKSDSNPPIVH